MHHKSACEAAQPCLLSVALNTLIVRGGTWDLDSAKPGLLRSRTARQKTCVLLSRLEQKPGVINVLGPVFWGDATFNLPTC